VVAERVGVALLELLATPLGEHRDADARAAHTRRGRVAVKGRWQKNVVESTDVCCAMIEGYRRVFVRARVGDVRSCDSYLEEGALGYAKTMCSARRK
jgi:hypothetical protein